MFYKGIFLFDSAHAHYGPSFLGNFRHSCIINRADSCNKVCEVESIE